MDDRLDAGDDGVDRGRVLERGDDDFLAVLRRRERGDVADAQLPRDLLQARPKLATEAAGGAGEEQPIEGRRAVDRGGGSGCGHGAMLSDAASPATLAHPPLRQVVRHRTTGSIHGCCPPMNLPASASPLLGRRPRNLALTVVDAIADRIRDGRLGPGAKLATESALMAEFSVSRTVIREALSKLQAAALVQTRHGIGTFVTLGGTDSAVFRIRADQLETLHDVVAMLELRIGIETEAASLAAQRRSDDNLAAMRRSLAAFTASGRGRSRRSGP